MHNHRRKINARRVQTRSRGLAEKYREMEVLYGTAAWLREQESFEDLCKGFLHRIKRGLGAQAGAVRLYCGGSEELLLLSHEGLSERFVEREQSLRCGQCLCGKAFQHGAPAVADLTRPPPELTLKNCVREGFQTAAAFTIRYKEQTLGVFNLYFDEPRQFNRQKIRLMETLGQHLGITVENQRLRSRDKELAVLEERNLIAQELHDSIAQSLAFLNIQAQLLQDSLKRNHMGEALETADQLRAGLRDSYEEVRELLTHFRTRVNHSDLDSAILSSLEKFEQQTGIRTEFDRLGNGTSLAPEDEIQALHIVLESLANIRKHAQATEVRVKVERKGDGVTIEVRDDGVGFDPDTHPALASERHVGLKIMQERASRIGGECRIDSSPGGGTRVLLTLPRRGKAYNRLPI